MNRLVSIIEKISKIRHLYVNDPSKDFTRNRKLPLETVIQLIISIGGSSIYTELLKANDYDVNTATSSTFVQQRLKLLPSAFEFLLHEFTQGHNAQKLQLFNDYRLFAVDSANMHTPTNPLEQDSYFENQYGGYNLNHFML